LEEGHIYEVIVSTYDALEQPNAAPMGISRREGSLVVRPFTSTLTYKSLLRRGSGVANITQDAELFYHCVFKNNFPGKKLPRDWFTEAELVDAPRLKTVNSWVEFRVGEATLSESRGTFACFPVHTVLGTSPIPPYSRVAHALMESVIHYTRIKIFVRNDASKARELYSKVESYLALAKRVAPQSKLTHLLIDVHLRCKHLIEGKGNHRF
jgi:hypothetical protein